MNVLKEFMEVLVNDAEQNCDLDTAISLEELSAQGGLYAEPGEGFADASYYDKSECKMVPVLFMCRSIDQTSCLRQLESICNYFQRLKKYPSGESFSWLNAEIAKYPSKIGRDEDGMCHYSAILNCKLYF